MGESLEDQVVCILNTTIKNVEITATMDIDLLELNVDSIMFIHIIIELEDHFNIEIPDEYLLLTELNTVSKMVNLISVLTKQKQHNPGDERI